MSIETNNNPDTNTIFEQDGILRSSDTTDIEHRARLKERETWPGMAAQFVILSSFGKYSVAEISNRT